MAKTASKKATDIPAVDLEGSDSRTFGEVNAFGGDSDFINAELDALDRGDGFEGVSDPEGTADVPDGNDPAGDDPSASVPPAELDDPKGEVPPSDEAVGQDGEGAEGEVTPDEPATPPEQTRPQTRMQKRLQKEIDKRKALEAQLEKLQADGQQEAPPAPPAPEKVDLFTADEVKAAQDALLDGEGDKFAEFLTNVLSRQEGNIRNELKHETQQMTQAEVQAATINQQLAVAADEIAAEYPQLDTRSADAQPALIDETIALRDFYASRGVSYPDALREAAATVAYKYGLGDDAPEQPASNSLADVPGQTPPAEKPQATKPIDVQKKIDLAQQEQGRLGGEGDGNRTLDIDLGKMSDEQFEKLTAETLSQLRGDNF